MNNSTDRRKMPPPTKRPEVGRRQFIGYLLGFSIVATAAGVFTPILGYLWPPSRTSSGGGGRVQAGTTADFPARVGTGRSHQRQAGDSRQHGSR